MLRSLRNRIEELQFEGTAKDMSIDIYKQQVNTLTAEAETTRQQSEYDRQSSQQKMKNIQQQVAADTGERVFIC